MIEELKSVDIRRKMKKKKREIRKKIYAYVYEKKHKKCTQSIILHIFDYIDKKFLSFFHMK